MSTEASADFVVNQPRRPVVVEPILFTWTLFGFPLFLISQLYILDQIRDKLAVDEGLVNVSQPNTSYDLCDINKSDPIVLFNDKVQADASFFSLMMNVASCVPAIFVSAFLGAYSDKVGRKYAILPPLITGMLRTVILVIVVLLNLNIGFILLGSFIEGCGGYYMTMLLGCFAYISDTTKPEKRRLRITICETTFMLSAFLGPFGTGILLKTLGYLWCFVICLIGQATVVLYTFFLVPETVQKDESAKFFDTGHIRRFIRVFTVRDVVSNRSFKLIILLLAFFVSSIANFDSLTTIYLANRPLCMSQTLIGYYNGTYIGASAVLSIFFAWLLKYLMQDSGVALLAGLAEVAKYIYFALITSTFWIFFTFLFGMFGFLYIPTIRTLMSNLVSKSEQGAVFGAIACVEITCTLISVAVFNPIYSATQSFMTGFAFICMAVALFIGCCVLMIYIVKDWLERKSPGYNTLVQADEAPVHESVSRQETAEENS